MSYAQTTPVFGVSIKQQVFVDWLGRFGSPAHAEGADIYTAIVASGMDPAIALGQFCAESSYGTTGYAATSRNWGNILWYSWLGQFGAVAWSPVSGYTYGKFPTWLAGARAYVALQKSYHATGTLSIAQMVARWLGEPATSPILLSYVKTILSVANAVSAIAPAPVVAAAPSADAIFDVTGYFAAGGAYVPLIPNRIVDSRVHLGLSGKLVSHVPANFAVTGRSSDASHNVPAGAIAVTGNLTVTNQTSYGYFSLSPTRPSGIPPTSTLNFPRADNRANGVTVALGSDGTLWLTFSGPA